MNASRVPMGQVGFIFIWSTSGEGFISKIGFISPFSGAFSQFIPFLFCISKSCQFFYFKALIRPSGGLFISVVESGNSGRTLAFESPSY